MKKKTYIEMDHNELEMLVMTEIGVGSYEFFSNEEVNNDSKLCIPVIKIKGR